MDKVRVKPQYIGIIFSSSLLSLLIIGFEFNIFITISLFLLVILFIIKGLYGVEFDLEKISKINL